MNRDAWLMFLGLAVASAVGLLAAAAWKKNDELGVTKRELAAVRQAAEQKSAHLAETSHALELERRRIEGLVREFSQITNHQQKLESEMRSALESRDVAVSALQGRLTVNILDRILFETGEAALRAEGMKVLDQVALVLSRFPTRQVQVFGHTDNVPIRVRFPSNWELSTARAVAAVRYLTEKAGVDPSRLSAVGCGEFQPIADNSTAEGRSKNRRIALVVLPEEFVPTDVDRGVTNSIPGAIEATGSTNTAVTGEGPAPAEKQETGAPAPSESVTPDTKKEVPSEKPPEGDRSPKTDAAPRAETGTGVRP